MTATPKPSRPLPGSRLRLYRFLLAILLLLTAEGTARVVYALLPKTPGLTVPPHLTRLDPDLGWRLRPNTRGSSKRTGRRVDYRINARGLRGRDIPRAKPAGIVRLAFLGDSRTFGFGVPEEDHFVARVETLLDGVEGLNLGVDGYGIDQALLLLRQEGFLYRPDVVLILVSHFGDERHLHDSRWGMGKPVFALENGELVLRNSPVANNTPGYVIARRLDQALSPSRFYSLLRDTLFHAGRHLRPTPVPAAPAAPPAPEAVAESLARQHHLYDTAWAILQAMHADCRARSAEFVLLTQLPDLHQRAAAAGMRSLDLAGALADPRYALPDGLAHINEAGNEVLAREIADYLRREGLAP